MTGTVNVKNFYSSATLYTSLYAAGQTDTQRNEMERAAV